MAVHELRVFISSTFRDLVDEREHLARKTFPEIRAYCRGRGITFTEVDLRWGVTDEEVLRGQVLRTCLEEVDRCRPYFICILGERYGFVPEVTEIYKDPVLLRSFPWIEQAALDGASIVDMEIRHAALSDPAAARARTRFFFKRLRRGAESGVSDQEHERLADLKDRIRRAGMECQEYRDAGSLGEMIYEELEQIVEEDFADVAPPGPLELERARHRAFAESRRHAYIPNLDYLRELGEWLADAGAPPLVVYAESGSGKSALVSFWCEQLRQTRGDVHVIEHYVGIGAGSADHVGIMRHIMQEIRERFDRGEEIPSSTQDIQAQFVNWLGFGRGAPIVLVIDGINQLGRNGRALAWLPSRLPDGVRLLITSTVEETLVELRERGWRTLGMQPFSEKEREAVAVRFLAEYHKALAPPQLARIVGDIKCSHPLFLRTLLEELRVEAQYETLDADLAHYLSCTGTEDLFQFVLERLEEDFGRRTIRETMSLIGTSRFGLTELELQQLTGISRLKLASLVSGLDYHLVRKDGQLTFFHDYLRRAVDKRYLVDPDVRAEYEARLIAWFAGDQSPRATRELIVLLSTTHREEELKGIVTEIPRVSSVWESEGRHELLEAWKLIPFPDLVARLGRSLDEWNTERDARDELTVLRALPGMLAINGAYDLLISVSDRCLQAARRLGDVPAVCHALMSYSQGLEGVGRTAEAVSSAEQGLALARRCGDAKSLFHALGVRALMHQTAAEYDGADALLAERESLARTMEDPAAVAEALRCRAVLAEYRGDVTGGLRCVDDAESIARELNDRMLLCRLMGSRSTLLEEAGDRAHALAWAERQEACARELGLPRQIELALAHRASLTDVHTQPDLKLSLLDEVIRIERAVGNPVQLGVVVGNRADVLAEIGRRDEALAGYNEAERLHREVGYRYGLPHWLLGRADLIAHPQERDVTRDELQTALDLVLEGLSIARLICKDVMVAECGSLAAEVLVALNREAEATQLLLELIAEARATRRAASHHIDLARLHLDPDGDHARAARDLLQAVRTESNSESIDELLAQLEATDGVE